MNKLWPMIPAALLTVGAQVAHAECASFGCNNVTVSKLQMTKDGGFYVATTGTETLAACVPNGGAFLFMPKTGNYKEIYATLLAAQLAGRIVSIELDPLNTALCTISYVTLEDA